MAAKKPAGNWSATHEDALKALSGMKLAKAHARSILERMPEAPLPEMIRDALAYHTGGKPAGKGPVGAEPITEERGAPPGRTMGPAAAPPPPPPPLVKQGPMHSLFQLPERGFEAPVEAPRARHPVVGPTLRRLTQNLFTPPGAPGVPPTTPSPGPEPVPRPSVPAAQRLAVPGPPPAPIPQEMPGIRPELLPQMMERQQQQQLRPAPTFLGGHRMVMPPGQAVIVPRAAPIGPQQPPAPPEGPMGQPSAQGPPMPLAVRPPAAPLASVPVNLRAEPRLAHHTAAIPEGPTQPPPVAPRLGAHGYPVVSNEEEYNQLPPGALAEWGPTGEMIRAHVHAAQPKGSAGTARA